MYYFINSSYCKLKCVSKVINRVNQLRIQHRWITYAACAMAHSLSNLFFEKNLLRALDKVFPIFSFTHFSILLTGVASKAWQISSSVGLLPTRTPIVDELPVIP